MGTVISCSPSWIPTHLCMPARLPLFIPTRHLLFCQALRGWVQGSRGRMWRLKASVWSGIPLGSSGSTFFVCQYMGVSKLDLYRYGTRLASGGPVYAEVWRENTQAQAHLS